jgi:hypothetical protein
MANVFKKAKAYQKLHPHTDWQTCIQRVSGKNSKKKVGKVKVKKTTTTVSGFGKKSKSSQLEQKINAGLTVSAAKHFLRSDLKNKLEKQLLLREVGTKQQKKDARKVIPQLKKDLKKLD